MTDRKNDGLVVWTLSYLRPYRKRVALLAFLLVSEIGLGTLQPWPLAVVIDFLSARPLPEPLTRVAPWIAPLAAHNKLAFLIAIVIAGVVLQVVNQFVSAYGTQVQVDTGQRMVYDLRARLFEHLTALGLHHHLTTSTADAVYRVDVDAYAIENLVMSGFFPLATSIVSLSVMFWILLRLNVTIALLSLTVVPFLYLCLRYYTSTLVNREERVKELESKLLERLYETFGAIRLVKSFSRETHELQRYTQAGETTMKARIAITWQSSLFSVLVSTITILGTALVVIVGGSFVLNGRLTIGQLYVVISYLGAVYGPLSAIAHTTGQLQGALAGTRRVRAMFALMPETVDAPDAIGADAVKGVIRVEGVGFTYPNGKRVLHDISFLARPGEMIALVGLTGAREPAAALLRRDDRPRAHRRHRRAQVQGAVAARADLDRAPGSGALPGDDRRQPALRPARRDARGDRGGGARRARARVHLEAAEGLRDGNRAGRRRAVRRRTPAAQHRPRDPQGRANPDPRRADLVTRRHLGRDRLRRDPPSPSSLVGD